MKLLPDKSKDYPLRFLFYWLILWALLFLYSTITMIPKISNDGRTVRKDVCLEEGSVGRFDEYTECFEYGRPNYVPVGKELIDDFKRHGFSSFFIMFIIGWFLRGGKKVEERINKKPFNEILSDKRIINYLNWITHKDKDVEEEYGIFYKKLRKGEPLEELFKKEKTGVGEFFLEVEKRSDDVYVIEFGIRYCLNDDFIDGSAHYGGNSMIRKVTFDENDSVTCTDEETISHFD